MPAQRAYEVGLVQEVYADSDSLISGVLETAKEIASKSPLAIWGTKVAMNYARDHGVDDALDQIATWQSGMFQPADMMEAFAAKAEKRAPIFPELLPEPRGL
jgi:enoyl-CoA hydratase